MVRIQVIRIVAVLLVQSKCHFYIFIGIYGFPNDIQGVLVSLFNPLGGYRNLWTNKK